MLIEGKYMKFKLEMELSYKLFCPRLWVEGRPTVNKESNPPNLNLLMQMIGFFTFISQVVFRSHVPLFLSKVLVQTLLCYFSKETPVFRVNKSNIIRILFM